MKLIIILLILFSTLNAVDENIKTKEIVISDSARLIITYNNYGTRSEGQTGRLVVDGKDVEGKDGEVKMVGAIKLKYYSKNNDLMWAPKAWNYEDREMIKYSWQK